MLLNKVCNIEDWDTEGRAEAMRRILPGFLNQNRAYPRDMEHRKHWEFAQVYLGFKQLGILEGDSMVLSVAAGHEAIAYELTNHVRWVFATDIYGTGPFVAWESDLTMLRDPDSFAPCPHNRRRLVVQYMDALDLRFEDRTFNAVYSLSSLEHFGGTDGMRRALAEQRRVVKSGGVVAFTTEVIVNGAECLDEGHLLLSTPDQIESLCQGLRGLRLIEPINFSVSTRTLNKVKSLAGAIDDSQRGLTDYPSIILEHRGREFTSISVFLERDD